MKKIFWLLVIPVFFALHLCAQCTGPTGDCDGDGILNAADTDNDNDGIPDAVENGLGTIQWAAAQLTAFSTTPFTASLGCGTNLSFTLTNNGGLSAFNSSTTNYNTLISADMGVAMTLPRSLSYTCSVPTAFGLQGTITVTLTAGTLYQLNLYFGDPENTSYIVSAYDASNSLIATTDWSFARLRTTGVTSTSLATPVINATNITYTATNASNSNDAFRVRFGEATLLQATKIVIENYRYSNSGTGGDGLWFFAAGICRPDTDADSTPNYLDIDSDADGCPDALEGGGPFLYGDLDVNGRLTGGVSAQGVPLITGSPQTAGTSYNNALFDAQSACAFPESYAISTNQPGMPGSLNLGSTPIQGSDEADQPSQGTWSGKAFAITGLPTNGFDLQYGGSAVTLGQIITGYNVNSLSIAPGASTPNGTTSTMFTYSTIDIAGQQDQTPASYTITWAQALLPLRLLSFTAKPVDNCALIFRWNTAEEINVLGYTIEESKDGKTFNAVAQLNSLGDGAHQYVFQLSSVSSPGYFRLRMEDKDGSVKYSDILSVKTNCASESLFRVYPNPARESVQISGVKPGDKISLYDGLGRVVKNKIVVAGAQHILHLNGVAPGIYLLQLISSSKNQATRIVVE